MPLPQGGELYCAIGDPMKSIFVFLVLLAMTAQMFGKVSKQAAGTADGNRSTCTRCKTARSRCEF